MATYWWDFYSTRNAFETEVYVWKSVIGLLLEMVFVSGAVIHRHMLPTCPRVGFSEAAVTHPMEFSRVTYFVKNWVLRLKERMAFAVRYGLRFGGGDGRRRAAGMLERWSAWWVGLFEKFSEISFAISNSFRKFFSHFAIWNSFRNFEFVSLSRILFAICFAFGNLKFLEIWKFLEICQFLEIWQIFGNLTNFWKSDNFWTSVNFWKSTNF